MKQPPDDKPPAATGGDGQPKGQPLSNMSSSLPNAGDTKKRAAEILAAAVQFAMRGFAVFPVHHPVPGGCSCRKPDCAHIGKHPATRNGVHDASNDVRAVERMFSAKRLVNIGIATGRVSGLFALDIDGPTGMHALKVHGYELPDTLVVRTGRGWHYFFRCPNDMPRISNKVSLFSKVDVRGDGGYVVAPPSLHASGAFYRFESDTDEPIDEAPKWLLNLLAADGSSMVPRIGESGGHPLGLLPEGTRNDGLTRIAGKIRRAGLSEVEAIATLLAANQERCRPPLGEQEVKGIVKSIYTNTDTDSQSLCLSKSVGIAEAKMREAARLNQYPIECDAYVSVHMKQLIVLCRELYLANRAAGTNDFFLSCRKAEELVGISKEAAGKMLKRLVADGLLVQTTPGTGYTAPRYQYCLSV